MPPPDHLQIVRQAMGVFNQQWQELEAGATFWADYVDKDVRWEENEPAFTGLEREYRGHAGLVQWFREVLEPWDFYAVEERRLEQVGAA